MTTLYLWEHLTETDREQAHKDQPPPRGWEDPADAFWFQGADGKWARLLAYWPSLERLGEFAFAKGPRS